MGATIFKDKVYISHDLDDILTTRERRVLLAHEVAHYKNKDRLRIAGVMLALSALTLWFMIIQSYIFAVGVCLCFRPLVRAYQRRCELRADKYAIEVTQDRDAFLSLMDKLQHAKDTHPSKSERIALANNMRLLYELN
jgi:Zn-dependent protease with chaperone function